MKPKRRVIRQKTWALFDGENGEILAGSLSPRRSELLALKEDHPAWIWTIRPVIVEYEIPAKGKEKP